MRIKLNKTLKVSNLSTVFGVVEENVTVLADGPGSDLHQRLSVQFVFAELFPKVGRHTGLEVSLRF